LQRLDCSTRDSHDWHQSGDGREVLKVPFGAGGKVM
jgi:hypothetical protein